MCGSSSSGSGSSSSGRSSSIVCYTCHEPGHKSPECPYKKSNDSGSDSRSVSSNKAGVRKGRTYNANWVSVRNSAPHVMGFVNGIKCKIVPDAVAEISIVPGCLVYSDQLTGEHIEVKGWDGRPVTLETAIVDFVFKGHSFTSRVAVSHKDSLCGAVLFSVPMETATAEHVLLDAASKSDVSGLGAGQLRGTHNIQPSFQEDACSGVVVEEAPATFSAPATTQEESDIVRVVTRSMSVKENEKEKHDNVVHVSESNPQPFDCDAEYPQPFNCDAEFDRLAAIMNLLC